VTDVIMRYKLCRPKADYSTAKLAYVTAVIPATKIWWSATRPTPSAPLRIHGGPVWRLGHMMVMVRPPICYKYVPFLSLPLPLSLTLYLSHSLSPSLSSTLSLSHTISHPTPLHPTCRTKNRMYILPLLPTRQAMPLEHCNSLRSPRVRATSNRRKIQPAKAAQAPCGSGYCAEAKFHHANLSGTQSHPLLLHTSPAFFKHGKGIPGA